MRIVLAVVCLCALAASVIGVERGQVELGTGLSAEYTKVYQTSIFTLSVPDYFRVGTFLSKNLSIEWGISSAIVATSSDNQSATSVTAGVAVHVPSGNRGALIYYEGFALLDILAGDVEGSQFGLGAGLGFKLGSSGLVPRIGGRFMRKFEGTFVATNTVQALIGLSFFTSK